MDMNDSDAVYTLYLPKVFQLKPRYLVEAEQRLSRSRRPFEDAELELRWRKLERRRRRCSKEDVEKAKRRVDAITKEMSDARKAIYDAGMKWKSDLDEAAAAVEATLMAEIRTALFRIEDAHRLLAQIKGTYARNGLPLTSAAALATELIGCLIGYEHAVRGATRRVRRQSSIRGGEVFGADSSSPVKTPQPSNRPINRP